MAAERTGDIDERLAANLTAAHRARWIAVIMLFVLLVAGVGALGWVVITQQSQLRSDCDFDRVLASAPLVAVKGLPPSKLGVTLVLGAREAYTGHHCGAAPANPTLGRWVRYYHLKH